MIIGASDSELNQVGEKLNHDQRYDRVVEFIELTRRILTDKDPVTYNGSFYTS
ncbi:Alkanesulfonate monooxygenase [compost metagenome]